ncbi:hypothetical protein FLW53_15630 [Microbispora sp. SCL1-1]|uniref:hypothetical protein n=1 Tax=unclassified Microbispora TaxID=2614687 RepID=UPI0011579768|nr:MULTISPECIES: hypothetical protein [unclassified Microbispora]NJP25599.1 hypothetical protein [Microbispora sp. CL1-1]TQS13548.1 hypothetical protein FLW53_15630 [Microbispora sp. SCL1-1]
MWRKLILSALLLTGIGIGIAVPVAANAREPLPQPSPLPTSLWTRAFDLADERIDQSSGLFASRVNPGVVWTFNDREGPLRLFAVGPDGRTRAVLTAGNVTAIDPEAMGGMSAPDGTAYLYVGDTGGNATPRSEVVVYRLVEPTRLADASVKATGYRLTYPDGAHDAETLLVDPRTAELYVVTKSPKGGAVYRAPAELSETGPNPMTLVRTLPYVVSDGVMAASGHMILRSYNKARVWDAVNGNETMLLNLPQQKQGEGVALTPDGKSLLISSEGVKSPVWRMNLPTALVPQQPRLRDVSDSAPEADARSMPSMPVTLGLGMAVVVLTAALIFVVRAENRRV